MLHAADNWTDEQIDAEVERIAEESRAQTPEIDAILDGSELETDDE